MSKRTQTGIATREGYEAYTGFRALERAGQCKNLHGHVHELMFCDKFNVNPQNILQGKQAMLTRSATAPVHDVVVMKDGHFAGGFQLKDTVSESGITKTLKQINSGKYNKTTLVGTEETAGKLAGRTTREVHSSGISSETTKRIADKALGRMPSASALGSVARSGGLAGAAIGAGIEAVSSLVDVYNGRKNFEDAVVDVGAATAKGGLTGAGSAIAGSVASGATGVAVSALASTSIGTAIAGTAAGATAIAAAPVVIGLGIAVVAGSLISSLWD